MNLTISYNLLNSALKDNIGLVADACRSGRTFVTRDSLLTVSGLMKRFA